MSAREKERRLPVSGYSRIPFMHVGKRGMLCNNKSSKRWCLCISVSVCVFVREKEVGVVKIKSVDSKIRRRLNPNSSLCERQ